MSKVDCLSEQVLDKVSDKGGDIRRLFMTASRGEPAAGPIRREATA
jgi:hypothetical protein